MEGLKHVTILVATFQLICQVESGRPNIKCKAGLEHYENGVCVGCVCSSGQGLNFSQVTGGNDEDNVNCAPCAPCFVGQFSNPSTNHVCVNCSMSCDFQNKITIKRCDGQNDVVCGQCLEGFTVDEDHICLSEDGHGRKRRQKLKEEDHTVYFALTAVLIPVWVGFICYCVLVRNKTKRGSNKRCSDSRHCTAHLVYTIDENSVKVNDVTSDERALITDYQYDDLDT